ncbi:MAG TPA: redoxin domain-containing protein [Candidatus Angelobacter sp.]|nr:redoxin domain-containing protein [Candidatus Angelobacter sp.]
MKMKMRMMLSVATGLGLAWSATAAATLKFGDPAPKLQVGNWVQGDPVKGFEKGKVYVVEFWATWCVPCRESIPHLNALYQQFKDKGVVVIGVDCQEDNTAGVAPFVKTMGSNMTYRVALDDKSKDENGAMFTTWMEASGMEGIPTAFIVNQQGVIAWIGHPQEMTEKLFNAILGGHYDIAKASADFDKEQAMEKEMAELSSKLDVAMSAGKWDEANSIVDQIAKADPEDTVSPQALRMEILFKQKKYDEAYKLVASFSDAHPDEAKVQDGLAWMLVARPDLEKRDTVLAQKLAERANKLTGGKDPGMLETLARAQFMNGKKEDAIATQQKALAAAANASQKATLQAALTSYQDGKLPDVSGN